MTAKNTELIKNSYTEKAIATLTKFAKLEAEYKALEKESKAATELIKEAMIAGGIDKVQFDPESGLSGSITLAERVSYKAEDIMEVEAKYLKSVVDTDKVKAEAVLTGKVPDGIEESRIQYVIKKFKVVE